MRRFRYLTHAEVVIDPGVPVPNWGLSDKGRERVGFLAASGALEGTCAIVSSAERKAVETAEILAAALLAPVTIREAMHENDRSATGYLPGEEFEEVANSFFAEPEKSVRGWERAVDAQARIVAETVAALRVAPAGDVLLIGHGGVGTLLLCHAGGLPISRKEDQPPGGGSIFDACHEPSEGADGFKLLAGWRRIEDILAHKPQLPR